MKRTHDEHCEQCIVIRHNDCTSWCTSLWHRCAITYVSMTAERRLWLQRVRLFHHEYAADQAVNTLPLESDTILNSTAVQNFVQNSKRPRCFQFFSFGYTFFFFFAKIHQWNNTVIVKIIFHLFNTQLQTDTLMIKKICSLNKIINTLIICKVLN